MIHLKVLKGTVSGNTEDLCTTCHLATRITPDLGETRTYCGSIGGWLTVTKIVECSSYSDSRLPTLSVMNRMAWILRTDGTKQNIGFVPNKEYFRENKDEDPYEPAYADPVVRKFRG